MVPFMDRHGSPNYSIITLQLELSYMTGGAHARNIGCGAHRRLSGYLLGSWASMWLVPGVILGVATALLYLGAKYSPCGGRCGWASLLPTPANELWLIDEGVEPPDRCCPVPSHRIG
jgi:hypothetical protein